MDRWAVVDWFGRANYRVMEWMDIYWWPLWLLLVATGSLIAMSPLKTHHEHQFHTLVAIQLRKVMLVVGLLSFIVPFVSLYIYDMTMKHELGDSTTVFLDWFLAMSARTFVGIPQWLYPALGLVVGWSGRFAFKRYAVPAYSAFLKLFRNEQTRDTVTDIRDESQRFKAKQFLPAKYYKKDRVFIGLDESNDPIYTPYSTWRETNMQIIGPTRFGKGVALGCLMDQGARLFNDSVFYIDPKGDKYAPYILKAAAEESGKPFYYVSLLDNELGDWSPFSGGNERAGLSRLQAALGLELSGDPGTDFYKTQELRAVARAFKKSRKIVSLAKDMQNDPSAAKASAELERWSMVKSLCPKSKGFSIAKALQEGAVVYFKGSLDDSVIKSATKVFISETIQEASRLSSSRDHHLTLVVDEVRFLASKELGDALATIVGFDVNLVLAYQSIKDIEQPDDRTLNGRALAQSVNVNCQLKLAYGGADFETAEWAANLSGTISKQITKMEGTDVSAAGGEVWKQERMVGSESENLINPNMVLSFPPMVCMFKQTGELARVAHTCFVPVTPTAQANLNAFLEQTSTRQGAQSEETPPSPKVSHEKHQIKTSTPEAGVESIDLDTDLSHKPAAEKQNSEEQDRTVPKNKSQKKTGKPSKPRSKTSSALDNPEAAAAIFAALESEPLPDDSKPEPDPEADFARETTTKKPAADDSDGVGGFVLDLSKLDLTTDAETLKFLDDDDEDH